MITGVYSFLFYIFLCCLKFLPVLLYKQENTIIAHWKETTERDIQKRVVKRQEITVALRIIVSHSQGIVLVAVQVSLSAVPILVFPFIDWVNSFESYTLFNLIHTFSQAGIGQNEDVSLYSNLNHYYYIYLYWQIP